MGKRYKRSNGLFDWDVKERKDAAADSPFALRSTKAYEVLDGEGTSVLDPWKDPIKEALETANAIFGPLPPEIGEQTAGTGRGQKTHDLIHFEQLLFALTHLQVLDRLEEGETRDMCGLALNTGRILAQCEVRAKSGLYAGRLRSLKGFRKEAMPPEAVRDAIEQIRSADPNLTKTQAVRQVAAKMGVGERRVWTLLSKAEH